MTTWVEWSIAVFIVLFFLVFGLKIVRWTKGMPKGAYLLMVLFPLISLFPIPPPAFKNIEKAKIEQRKKQKQDDDDDKNE